MRVHAFARRFPSLSQTFVLNQCTGLLDLGADRRDVELQSVEPIAEAAHRAAFLFDAGEHAARGGRRDAARRQLLDLGREPAAQALRERPHQHGTPEHEPKGSRNEELQTEQRLRSA